MTRGYVIAILFALAGLFMPLAASAVGMTALVPSDCQGGDAATKCTVCDLAQLASNALDDGIYIAVFISAVLFAWSGAKMVTSSSAGNTAGVSAARKTITNVAIGLVILMCAWMIVNVLMSTLTNTSTWNNLCSGGTTSLTEPPASALG